MSLKDSVSRAKPAAPPPSADLARTAGVGAAPQKRIVSDVPADEHKALRAAALEEGQEVSKIIRVLAGLYLDDADLRTRVHERIARLA